MLAQYLWVKWVEIIFMNSIIMVFVMLVFFSIEKLLNITFSYGLLFICGIFPLIFAEIFKYKKWLRNGGTF
ncbi:hypothetical protein BKP45_10055 [Anaerobacillus alkalidiazotrophicus]|uniref:Uncharacterized protein n=1 Tax=Anaerobacillus alkalidiazotrophicus TaxID=472963 RepID=A0A1S2M615_9BACI|nr:hypothetical protein [Anaerobacillus alkalidiazotrophicus]OIJ20121.1 hypothetical protein BKP45_10055 [Anaerobacillus alkalidiazotrophicus]